MDKSSNSVDQIISSPAGGGALKRIGKSFLPDLHTGTGNFSVPTAVLPGRNEFPAAEDDLLRVKTRKPRHAPLSQKIVVRVLELTCALPLGAVTHRTCRAMAKAAGVSLRVVQGLWQKHWLQPHRLLIRARYERNSVVVVAADLPTRLMGKTSATSDPRV